MGVGHGCRLATEAGGGDAQGEVLEWVPYVEGEGVEDVGPSSSAQQARNISTIVFVTEKCRKMLREFALLMLCLMSEEGMEMCRYVYIGECMRKRRSVLWSFW